MSRGDENKKDEAVQREQLNIELQGINQLIGSALHKPQLYSADVVAQLVERKRTLEQLINDSSANPFYCFTNL